jgi:hypothetical protein
MVLISGLFYCFGLFQIMFPCTYLIVTLFFRQWIVTEVVVQDKQRQLTTVSNKLKCGVLHDNIVIMWLVILAKSTDMHPAGRPNY